MSTPQVYDSRFLIFKILYCDKYRTSFVGKKSVNTKGIVILDKAPIPTSASENAETISIVRTCLKFLVKPRRVTKITCLRKLVKKNGT